MAKELIVCLPDKHIFLKKCMTYVFWKELSLLLYNYSHTQYSVHEAIIFIFDFHPHDNVTSQSQSEKYGINLMLSLQNLPYFLIITKV